MVRATATLALTLLLAGPAEAKLSVVTTHGDLGAIIPLLQQHFRLVQP